MTRPGNLQAGHWLLILTIRQANYFWGLSSEKTGNDSDALDGYSVATLSPEFRQAAWLRIAYLNIKKRNWKEADYVIRQMSGELSSE